MFQTVLHVSSLTISLVICLMVNVHYSNELYVSDDEQRFNKQILYFFIFVIKIFKH